MSDKPDGPSGRPLLLPPNLGGLADFASTTYPGRYALANVHLVFDADTYCVEATDRKEAVVVTGQRDAEAEGLAAGGRADASAEGGDALIAADDWKRAFQALPKRPRGTAGVAVALGPQGATLTALDGAASTVVQAPAEQGRYPDIDVVVPQGPPTARVVVNPDYLVELLRLAARIGGGEPVVIDFYADVDPTGDPKRRGQLRFTEPLVLRASNLSQELLALLMPMTGD